MFLIEKLPEHSESPSFLLLKYTMLINQEQILQNKYSESHRKMLEA